MHKKLRKLGITYKKKVLKYKERNEKRREKYLEEIEGIPKECLFYVDECGIDEHLIREHARAPRNQRVYGDISGKRFARQNIIAAWNVGKIVAPMGFQCTCDSVLTETWAKRLVEELPPKSVVVLDNASFHNKKRLKAIIEGAGHKVIFLPPYSPDLNPIEHFWDWLKNKIRDIAHQFETLELAIMAAVNAR